MFAQMLSSQKPLFVGKHEKTKQDVLCGTSNANIRFDEICGLLCHLGFKERIKGDHHIFSRSGVFEIVNLQPVGGKAKPYQVRQVKMLINRYNL
jgi:hypothetical protein